MKAIKIIVGILVGFVVIAAAYFAYALYINPKSPMGSAAYSNGDKEISVRYYRPYKKDRLILVKQLTALWFLMILIGV